MLNGVAAFHNPQERCSLDGYVIPGWRYARAATVLACAVNGQATLGTAQLHEHDVVGAASLPGEQVVTVDKLGKLVVWEERTGRERFAWETACRLAGVVAVPGLGFAAMDSTGWIAFFEVQKGTVRLLNERPSTPRRLEPVVVPAAPPESATKPARKPAKRK
jgi:hypothetical protein